MSRAEDEAGSKPETLEQTAHPDIVGGRETVDKAALNVLDVRGATADRALDRAGRGCQAGIAQPGRPRAVIQGCVKTAAGRPRPGAANPITIHITDRRVRLVVVARPRGRRGKPVVDDEARDGRRGRQTTQQDNAAHGDAPSLHLDAHESRPFLVTPCCHHTFDNYLGLPPIASRRSKGTKALRRRPSARRSSLPSTNAPPARPYSRSSERSRRRRRSCTRRCGRCRKSA